MKRCNFDRIHCIFFVDVYKRQRQVETNIRHGGRSEELTGDYETELLEIMKAVSYTHLK